MYFLHAINGDSQTRLLNVLGQIVMILGDLKKNLNFTNCSVYIEQIVICNIQLKKDWSNTDMAEEKGIVTMFVIATL